MYYPEFISEEIQKQKERNFSKALSKLWTDGLEICLMPKLLCLFTQFLKNALTVAKYTCNFLNEKDFLIKQLIKKWISLNISRNYQVKDLSKDWWNRNQQG